MVLICGYRLSSKELKSLLDQYEKYHPKFRDRYSMSISDLNLAKHLPKDARIIVYKDEAFLAIDATPPFRYSKGFCNMNLNGMKRSIKTVRHIIDNSLIRNFFLDIDTFKGEENPTYFWR